MAGSWRLAQQPLLGPPPVDSRIGGSGMSGGQTGTVTTKVPARLDRLPWSLWHWMIIIGVQAERKGLEDIAQPLTAEEAAGAQRDEPQAAQRQTKEAWR
jgi:hypothetical protein